MGMAFSLVEHSYWVRAGEVAMTRLVKDEVPLDDGLALPSRAPSRLLVQSVAATVAGRHQRHGHISDQWWGACLRTTLVRHAAFLRLVVRNFQEITS